MPNVKCGTFTAPPWRACVQPDMNLPLPLEILSRLSPMRYAVDVMRDIFYTGTQGVALESLETNVAIIAIEFVLFMLVGTAGFVRAERNR